MKHSIAFVLLAACASSSKPAPVAPAPVAASSAAKVGAVIAPEEPCEGLLELTAWPGGVEIAGVDQLLRIQNGSVDVHALRAAMAPFDEDALCANVAEIGAGGDATYADLVAAMDAARAVDHYDIGVVGGSSAMYPDPPRPKQPSDAELVDSLAKPAADLAKAPILRISASAMRLEDTVIDDVAPLGDVDAMQGLHEALRDAREALPAGEQPMMILQAEKSTPARLVIDAMGAARAAGYDRVLFAI